MPSRAWLLMAVNHDDRQFGGNDGYSDNPDVFYSWDSRVPNATAVSQGDRVVLWDKHTLIGASLIESIETGEGLKTLYRCKRCKKASIKRRKERRPIFRCHNQDCKAQFDDPATETVLVATYRSMHDAAWVPLDGVLSGAELRVLGQSAGSQHAIRPLLWDSFKAAIAAKGHQAKLNRIESRSEEEAAPLGGLVTAMTRVRRGKARLRKNLLDESGRRCAITGPCPEDVLEAGHLYSYAALGAHRQHGGLLLRQDVHRLLDRGALSIHPDSLTVSVSSALTGFPMYAGLEGQGLQVTMKQQQQRWFRAHWEQHRNRTC